MSAVATVSKSHSREDQIFAAAFDVFTRYGFQRTSMDDIARAAEMSRPALYLHFRNKRDIYRALAGKMTRDMTSILQSRLDEPGPAAGVLSAAFESAFIDPLARIEATAHGMELIDMKNDLADDIMADLRARKHKMLAAFFERYTGEAGKSGALADLLIDAFEGAKMRARSIDELRGAVRSAIDFVASLARSPAGG